MRIFFWLAHEDLRRTCSWCCQNSLLISADKTKILIIGVPQLLRRVPSVAISILGKEITPVPVARDLGVFIDQYLTYDEHLTQTAAKCLCKLVQINRIKHLLDKETLLLLINALSLASYSIVLLYFLIRVNRVSANFSVYRTSLHG